MKGLFKLGKFRVLNLTFLDIRETCFLERLLLTKIKLIEALLLSEFAK